MDPKLIAVLVRAIANIAKNPAQRSDIYIKTLKQFKLDPTHPPADFDGVYAYALVEYALAEDGKSDTLLSLFGEPEIKAAFRRTFDQWDATPLSQAMEQRLDWQDYGNEWNFIRHAIRSQGIDIEREMTVFFDVFLHVVRRSQLPGDRLQSIEIGLLQQDLQALREQLAQIQDFETFAQRLVDRLTDHFTNQLADQTADKVVEKLGGRSLPASHADANEETTENEPKLLTLPEILDGWFEVLGYGRESYRVNGTTYFEWLITIPVRRKRYDRVVVRGVTKEAGLSDLQELRQSVERQGADEGWLVSNMRVSSGARKATQQDALYDALTCYTLDELLDEDANFDAYLTWLEAEITQKGIDADYVPLGCSKDEVDLKSKQKIGVSHYGEDEGWIEGYVDQWLADSSKEHLSVLGEFGTGKTWFALHYAWLALQKYKEAKRKGVARPRLPLVIPLRDYAKAVSAESLFSEFFFRKHQIPLPGYDAFEQLNRMGKLLLIFDGFDEMAARINQQSMIDNFWELAKVVVPGAKAILTCRTEHFPDAIAGRRLLNAELKASTSNLTGEPPQFEVLELAKFSDDQIGDLLGRKAKTETV
ncbi:MAG: NACHT domain-containing protein, partial [Cyanobacteria bacterium P01_F01_bin.150]